MKEIQIKNNNEVAFLISLIDQPDGHFEKHDAPALCHPCAIPGTGPNNIRMFLCFCKPTPFPST